MADEQKVNYNPTIPNKTDATTRSILGQTIDMSNYIDSVKNINAREFNMVLDYYLTNGTLPKTYGDQGSIYNIKKDKNFQNALEAVKAMLNANGITEEAIRLNIINNGGVIRGDDKSIDYEAVTNDVKAISNNTTNAQTNAFNNYWNEIYSRNNNTLGADAYNNLYNAELNAGQQAIDLANAQVQQQGLAQAATVKSIVDQVRNERMARLRAGMSESQIANQDMQTMIANTNALNDSIVAANMAKLQGQQQKQSAQETAYNNWLQSMGTIGQSASAFAAADAGDLNLTAQKIKDNTGLSYNQAIKYAQAAYNNGKNQ